MCQVECLSGYYHCTARPVRHNGWPLSSCPEKPASSFRQDDHFSQHFGGKAVTLQLTGCSYGFLFCGCRGALCPRSAWFVVPVTAVMCSEG